LGRAQENEPGEEDQSERLGSRTATTPRGVPKKKKKKKAKPLREDKEQPRLVNAEKMRMIWKIVNEIRTFQQQSRYDSYFQELRIEERKSVKKATKKGARSPRLTLATHSQGGNDSSPSQSADESEETESSLPSFTMTNSRLPNLTGAESPVPAAPADLHAFLVELAPCMNEDRLYELSLQREPKRGTALQQQ